MTDPVNHPPHYKANGLEAIDVIEAFGLGFHLGNVVKYILRAGRKDHLLQDLRKSRWYLDREVRRREAGNFHCGDDGALNNFRLCYLATPYSKYKGGNLVAAFEEAAQLAATLLAAGVRVYSPIVHTHPLAVHGNLDPLDHSIWLPFDEAMMEAADCLIVAHMDGWDLSFGIAHEVEFFTAAGKPIFDLDPGTLGVSQRKDSSLKVGCVDSPDSLMTQKQDHPDKDSLDQMKARVAELDRDIAAYPHWGAAMTAMDGERKGLRQAIAITESNLAHNKLPSEHAGPSA